MPDPDHMQAPAERATEACQAIDAILCAASGFAQLEPWCQALRDGLEAGLPARSRAPALQRLGLVALLRDGDVVTAGRCLEQALELPESADPDGWLPALRAQAGIVDCLAGRLVRADVRLSDAELDSRLPGRAAGFPAPARCWLEIALALNRLLRGDGAGALELLGDSAETIPDPGPAALLRLELALYAAALLGRRELVSALSARLAPRLFPLRLTLLEAGRHFVLGVAALRQGEALRARVHAEECASAGSRAGAGLAGLLAGLLQAQALADLQRADEARSQLQQLGPDWSRLGLSLPAAMGCVELARLDAHAGELDRARQALVAARALLPAGESLASPHRGPDSLPELERRLDGVALPASSPQAHVRIHTLGEFVVEIGGRRLYDRDWKGRRTKSLLLALIREGGYKVPAERLSDLLWPDSDGDQAAQNLKVALHRLRRLGCAPGEAAVNWIHVRHGQVSLARGLCWVDTQACCN